jgi:hypothetical protein
MVEHPVIFFHQMLSNINQYQHPESLQSRRVHTKLNFLGKQSYRHITSDKANHHYHNLPRHLHFNEKNQPRFRLINLLIISQYITSSYIILRLTQNSEPILFTEITSHFDEIGSDIKYRYFGHYHFIIT